MRIGSAYKTSNEYIEWQSAKIIGFLVLSPNWAKIRETPIIKRVALSFNSPKQGMILEYDVKELRQTREFNAKLDVELV